MRFIGQFPFCKPNLFSGESQFPEQLELVLGSGSHRGESKPCSDSDPDPCSLPGCLRHLRDYWLSTWTAGKCKAPVQTLVCSMVADVNEYFVSPQKVDHSEQSFFDRSIGSLCQCCALGL